MVFMNLLVVNILDLLLLIFVNTYHNRICTAQVDP